MVVAPISRSRLRSSTVSKSMIPMRPRPVAARRTAMSRPTEPAPTTRTDRRVMSRCIRLPQEATARTWLRRAGGGGTSASFHVTASRSPTMRTFSAWVASTSRPVPRSQWRTDHAVSPACLPSSISMLRAACTTQSPVGCAVIPTRCTRRRGTVALSDSA